MPKINSISVALDGDKQVYRAGEEVNGTWYLNLGESFSVRGVRVSLQGAAYTRWEDDTDSKKDDKKGYEQFTSQWKTVFGTKLGAKSSENHELGSGKHQYRFSFWLPDDKLPSSYEGKYGAIRYWLMLQIDRPILRFNIERFKHFTVLDDIDVNLPEFVNSVGRKTEKNVYKALGFGDQGVVELSARTNRGAYCPGEKIALSMIANNKSDRDLGIIKASLVQQADFRASGEEKRKTFILRTITGTELKAKGKRTWSNQLIAIPAVPSTTRDRTCHIINVKYFVKIIVDIAKIHGGDACIWLPITIGTIPQVTVMRVQQPPGASNIGVIDVSSAITYTQCNNGLEQFNQGEKKFPKFNYIPWCAYVSNYIFPQIPTTKPTKKTENQKPTPQQTHFRQAIIPSAPPLVIAPPSYDDVMKEITAEKPTVVGLEQCSNLSQTDSLPATENKLHSAASKPLLAEKRGHVVLTVRFPDKCLVDFRSCLAKTGESLSESCGKAIALAPQIIVNSGCWPPRTSLALFLFDTQTGGTEWFSGFKELCDGSQVQLIDVNIVTASKEQFQNEKNIVNMTVIKQRGDTDAKERTALLKEAAALSREQVVPTRLEHGGVNLCVGQVKEQLAGDMFPQSGEILTISQWDSIQQLSAYLTELKGEKFKKVLGIYKKCYESILKVSFQTEDLSFIHENAREENYGGDVSSIDDRKEEV